VKEWAKRHGDGNQDKNSKRSKLKEGGDTKTIHAKNKPGKTLTKDLRKKDSSMKGEPGKGRAGRAEPTGSQTVETVEEAKHRVALIERAVPSSYKMLQSYEMQEEADS